MTKKKIGRPKTPEKLALSASARACFTKAEYASLGRYARQTGTTISRFLRVSALAAMIANPAEGRAS